MGPGASPAFPGLRPVVALLQKVPAQLAQLRVLQRLAGNGVVRETLVGRQPFRALFDGFADRPFCVVVRQMLDLAGFRHDHGDQPVVFLQNPDLPYDGALRVGGLDVFGLNVLAALGHDEGRGAAGDVQIALVVEVSQVPGAEPAVFGEDLGGLVREVAVTGEYAGSARQDLPLLVRRVRPPLPALLVGHCRRVYPDLRSRNGTSHAGELLPVGLLEGKQG
jgi:hypothetical protein